MEKHKKELEEALAEVLRRSSVDLEFRCLALKDPHAAITKVNSRVSLDGLVFRFVDNSKSTKTIPLPNPVTGIEENELSESDLECVAGGTDAPPPPTTVSGG